MANMDKGLTVPKYVLIVQLKIPQMPQNLSAFWKYLLSVKNLSKLEEIFKKWSSPLFTPLFTWPYFTVSILTQLFNFSELPSLTASWITLLVRQYFEWWDKNRLERSPWFSCSRISRATKLQIRSSLTRKNNKTHNQKKIRKKWRHFTFCLPSLPWQVHKKKSPACPEPSMEL